jgi:Family of unknown function (DUF6504)
VRKFVSAPLLPGEGFVSVSSGNEPPVPAAFLWGGRTLRVAAVARSWRSTKTDRGDAYLKRHWFELRTEDGATLEVYYDREVRRGAPQWWLYTIDDTTKT